MATTHDEGFHEIQLNGKQLVFLFMAATVVSVVIFLCGVLVGRGVRVERGVVSDTSSGNAIAETTPEAAPTPAAAPAPAGSDPRAAAPPPPVDDLSYFNRLEAQKPATEALKAGADKRQAAAEHTAPPPPAPPAKTAVAEPKPAAPEPKPAAQAPAPVVTAQAHPSPPAASPARQQPVQATAAPPASSEPAGGGYAVQIAALNVRGEADAIAKRLTAKGYAAYVLSPPGGSPTVFRVRVGKYTTRREAESVAAKLKKEEQFNPWVTR
jgi:DedD protein